VVHVEARDRGTQGSTSRRAVVVKQGQDSSGNV
jgi:hypothetical protein